MAVTRGQFSKWPENVAFKRILREIVRAQQYVPPKQPLGTGPPPEGAAVSADSSSTRPNVKAAAPVRIGSWTLDEDADGNLVARHIAGYEQTIATLPERER